MAHTITTVDTVAATSPSVPVVALAMFSRAWNSATINTLQRARSYSHPSTVVAGQS